MRFQALKSDASGIAQWRSMVDSLPPQKKDIHFLPEYGEVYRKTYGHEPFLAVFGDQQCFVIQPFVKRRLNDLPFLRDRKNPVPYYDIANPYGYGGPVCQCRSPKEEEKLFAAFDAHFLEFCRRERLASEFSSLHPLLKTQDLAVRSGTVNLVRQKEVVYLDLDAPESQRWKVTRKGHKSSITKARKSGVQIRKVEPTPDNFDQLNRLYYETMRRNNADQRWFFPENYFKNCFECLGQDRVSLFFAYMGGIPVSASILMHDFETVYYHFSGSDSRFYEFCPNNLLIFEMAKWAEAMGFRRFHLGGGVTSSPDDSLFVFKAGFSDKRAAFYTCHRVLDQVTYEHLCNLKMEYELVTEGKVSESDFFPLYRR